MNLNDMKVIQKVKLNKIFDFNLSIFRYLFWFYECNRNAVYISHLYIYNLHKPFAVIGA